MADSNVTAVKAEVIDGSSPRSGASGPKRRRVSWSMLLSGVLFLILGIVCWAWPNLALETIALILGIGFLVAGVGAVADYVLARGFFSAWLLVDGILDVILGIIFIVNPLVSAWALAWLVAIAIIVSGIMQLFSCWRLRHDMSATWWLSLITGVITIVLGILMLAVPSTLALWLSIFAIVYGVGLVVFAFKVPKLFD